ncbi:MAG: bi-domain-containing oxidoreductase [Phycisphaerales bacterium]|nr:MAG: bi-domain-containing oxidoreductase [Phycisphaerales bacterium]
MKQVLQSLKTGQIDVADVPCPLVRPGHVLIQTRASLISAGTERSFVEFGKASLLAKARSKPDKVRQVLDKIKTDGLLPTLETVFARLDEPFPLGYCSAGVVVEVGEGAHGFEIGDRVVSNGSHAEMVCVPSNLCARIPDGVSDEEAAFTVLGAIGLQGIRLIGPTLGETIAVTGLGLIGLMTVQMLRANGCRVLGIDPDPARCELARQMGAETVDLSAGADPVASAMAFSQGRGVDGVVITAAASTDEIMHQSAQMSRKRGRIVLVGVVGLKLTRSDFYEKELTFQVSCSYGPGRYDPAYEDRGLDYPIGFVRWTEQRNFEAVLELLASGRLDVEPLISKRIEHSRAVEAYQSLTEQRDALGILLTYPHGRAASTSAAPVIRTDRTPSKIGPAVVGVIGAGDFAKLFAFPNLIRTGARLACVADVNGVAAAHAGRKFGFERTTSDYRHVLDDPQINTAMVLTRHDAHAPIVLEALQAGKHVMVEKPLCLEPGQLDRIREAFLSAQDCQLAVGFNRRFSPHALKMKSLLATRTEPLCMSMMVNAGVVPPDVWVHDPKVGGGRILGEGCHWIDLMSFLAGAPVIRVFATKIGTAGGVAVREDKTSITLCLGDGSIGTLHYFGSGHKSYPKETVEVFCDGKVLRLDNFRMLRGYGWPAFKSMRLRRMDKGHREEYVQFVQAVESGGPPLIPFEEIENVTRATFAAVESAASGEPVDVE